MTYPHPPASANQTNNVPPSNNDDRITLYYNPPESEDSKKPLFKGILFVNGQKYEVALWPDKQGRENQFNGTVKPPYKKP